MRRARLSAKQRRELKKKQKQRNNCTTLGEVEAEVEDSEAVAKPVTSQEKNEEVEEVESEEEEEQQQVRNYTSLSDCAQCAHSDHIR